MAQNLRIIKNVLHNGTQLVGRIIKDNQVISNGSVFNLEQDTRGLKQVAQDLVDRGLAEYTNDPATHTTTLVNQAQQAMPVDTPSGEASAPAADSLKQNLEHQKQVAADKTASVDKSQLPAPPPVDTKATATAAAAMQPTPVATQPSAEEIAKTAAAVA